MVDGEVLARDFSLSRLDGDQIAAEGRRAAAELAERAGI
jgi:hypothetical protein